MANTTGTAGGGGSPQGGAQGWDAAVNLQPIPMSNAGTTAAGTAGTAFSTLNADFTSVVTNLVIRNLVDYLRKRAVILQEGSFIRARQVPGTNTLVYAGFPDLGAADALLEGVPPETAKLAIETFSFAGTQKGKLVAITDLGELFSPFELYSVAAEKVAWNAIDTAETDVITALTNATPGISFSAGVDTPQTIIDAVVALKIAEVPMFPDGTYHAFVHPTQMAKIRKAADALGWTDAVKYARPEALLNGEVGTWQGIRFIETTRANATKGIVFGPEVVAWGDYQSVQAYRVAPGGDHADPLAQRGLVGWKGMWGVKVVSFDGSPPMGASATNIKGERFLQLLLP